MALEFDADTHTYTLDGIALPSVTHITRYASYDSANGAQTHLRDAAAERGRLVHEYCQAIDYDGEAAIPGHHADCNGFVIGYKAFLRDYGIRGWVAVEMPMASQELGYAGTLDRLGYIDNELAIVDLKTSATVNKLACGAQLNGYQLLAREAGYDAKKLMIIQLLKKGDYRVYQFPVDQDAFTACEILYRINENYKTKRRASA